MARVNTTRYALMGMLAYQPMSGYDMKKMSDRSIGHFWQENFGAIYPMLRRLEEEGLVVLTEQETDAGRRERKVYALTDDGRSELTAWLGRDPARRHLREELLLKLFFGQWADPGRMAEMVRAERREARAAIRAIEAIEEHIGSDHTGQEAHDAGQTWWLMTVRFGVRFYRAIDDWCGETLAALEETTKESDR